MIARRSLVSPASVFAGSAPADTRISMVSSGSTFAPRVYLDTVTYPDAEVMWRFADGTTSQSLTPSYSGSGTHTLQSNIPEAIRCLNFGFDGGDAGYGYSDQSTYEWPVTGLVSIANLQNGCPHLERFLADSSTTFIGADCSGLDRLRIVEFCYSNLVATANYSGCTALVRVCHENTAINSYDLRDALAIEDVRGRGQRIGSSPFSIRVGDASHLWHFCVGSQAGTITNCSGLFDGTSNMPAMQQFWTWGSGVGGALAPRAGSMQSLQAADSGHTSFDASHITWPYGGACDVSGNPLVSLNLTGMSNVGNVDLSNCSMSQALVDYALAFFAAGTHSGGTLYLAGNAAPSSVGLADRATLQERGWTVTVAI